MIRPFTFRERLESRRPDRERHGRITLNNWIIGNRIGKTEPEPFRHRDTRRIAKVAADLDMAEPIHPGGDAERGPGRFDDEPMTRSIGAQPVAQLPAVRLGERDATVRISREEID